MKTRQLWAGIVLLVMLCLTIGVSQAQEKAYSAERFDVDITVEEGGSVLVTETVVFDFVGGPFTFIFRELPLDLTDGISIIESSVDGVVYPIGANPGQVEVSTGNPMRITWHLEPTSNATRTAVLTYRADGVVRRENGMDVLYWQPLPDDYDYFIGESTTAVTYPPGIALISEPAVLAGTADVRQSGNQVTFTTRNLQPDTPLVFMLQFDEGSLITTPPDWQLAQQAAAERRAAQNAQLPYWIAFSVLLLGGGAAGLFAYRRGHTAPSANTRTSVMEPPDKLAAGMAGALVTQGAAPHWNHAQGTLFSLAERGVLIIEELPEKKWYRQHDFAVKQVEYPSGLLPHEEGFLEMLFESKDGRSTSIKLSKVSSKITGSAWKKYKEPLQADLQEAGLLSKSRKAARRTLTAIGGVLLFLGLAGIVGAALLIGALGFGPLFVATAVAFLGLAGLIFGSTLSPLSDGGAETAVAWNAFHNYLKDVSKGRQSIDSPTTFEKYLPYAAAFGLLQRWANRFEKEGWTDTPAYFHVLPSTTRNQAVIAFVAMSHATHSSGGSAAGAGGAGAGAAGGGASGAG